MLSMCSQASSTSQLLFPKRKFPCSKDDAFEPTMTVGSNPACSRIVPIIAVVVLFPCVPEIAIVSYSFVISPRSSG
ncbi:MAG: hypothetical protein ACD_76C00149G0001 [uncultured bacterium]|nr:MAG: hypothetical protein ACD_76C00149G0001 [uncultured bacterium]